MAVFEMLNALNVNGHTEQKNVGGTKLTYLSWPWAWAEVKKAFPDAHYTIWRNANGLPYTFDPETGYMVYTSVTIEGITHEMWLPVMDGANKAMKQTEYDYKVKNPNFKYAKKQQDGRYLDSCGREQPEFIIKHCEAATMMDINKTIMRCLVKNLAMFGLGLYIYAGEDLPEAEKDDTPEPVQSAPVQRQSTPVSASVTTAGAIPQADAEEPKKGPVGPEPGLTETPGAYIKRRIVEIGRQVEGFNFMTARAALIEGGVIEDIPSATMKMPQAVALMDATEKSVTQKVKVS